MSKVQYLKDYLRDFSGKSLDELSSELKKEKSEMAKLATALWRGSSKKTDQLKKLRRRLSLLQTLITQKRYLSPH